MGNAKVQVLHCEDVFGFNKKQDSQDNLLLFSDLEFIFGLPYFCHVKGDAHIDQVCIVLKCVHC
jgi:hypothetical protein